MKRYNFQQLKELLTPQFANSLQLYYNKLRLHFSAKTALELAVDYLLEAANLQTEDYVVLMNFVDADWNKNLC